MLDIALYRFALTRIDPQRPALTRTDPQRSVSLSKRLTCLDALIFLIALNISFAVSALIVVSVSLAVSALIVLSVSLAVSALIVLSVSLAVSALIALIVVERVRPPAGPRLKDGPESAKRTAVSVGLRWGFILSPSARTGPSRLGAKPATRKVADGERMNPRGGGRIRAHTGETSSTRAMSTWRRVHAGARAPVPPVYGSGRPAFSPPTVLRGRGRIFPAPARGNPAPRV